MEELQEYLRERIPYSPDGDSTIETIMRLARRYTPEVTLPVVKKVLKGRCGRIEFTQDEAENFVCRVYNILSKQDRLAWLENWAE